MSDINSATNLKRVFLVSGMRTPFGKFGGSLMDVTPVDLAKNCSEASLKQANLNIDKIDQVILGSVVPSSTDTLYGGRHLGLKLGSDVKTPGICLNRLCGSGIEAIWQAARVIKLGEADCVLSAGAENMSMTPHLVYGSRFGTKFGSLKNVDMLLDSLTDKLSETPMGITAENLAKEYGISRGECDQFAFESHDKANKAYNEGFLQGEISSFELRKKTLEKDEHIRGDASLEGMAKLRPSFLKEGVVTPANASGIVDGSASVIVASEEFCEKEGLTPLTEILDYQVVGVDPKIMGIGPAPAISSLLEKNGLNQADISLFEINEAFASQTLACVKELKMDTAQLNIWGGAIAFGHPLAASGVRISLTLARQLKHIDGKLGVASACIGGGQGISLLLRNVK